MDPFHSGTGTSHPWDLAAMQHHERVQQASRSALIAQVARDRRRARRRARAAWCYAWASNLCLRVGGWLDARAVRSHDLTRRTVQ